MAAICSMIFLMIVLGLAVLLVWSVWATIAAIFAKRKLLFIALGLPVSVLVVALGFAGLWFYTTRPAYVFRQEFGFPAPPDTVLLDASASVLGDYGSASLRFRTSTATLARLTAGYNLDPNVKSHKQHFVRESSGNFAFERRRIVYDPATGETAYEFEGID